MSLLLEHINNVTVLLSSTSVVEEGCSSCSQLTSNSPLNRPSSLQLELFRHRAKQLELDLSTSSKSDKTQLRKSLDIIEQIIFDLEEDQEEQT